MASLLPQLNLPATPLLGYRVVPLLEYNNSNDTQASLEIDTTLNNGTLLKAVSIFDRTTGKLIIIPVN